MIHDIAALDTLATAGVLDSDFAAELSAPRALTETSQEFAARRAAATDIAADLLMEITPGEPDDSEAIAGGPDPWWETHPADLEAIAA